MLRDSFRAWRRSIFRVCGLAGLAATCGPFVLPGFAQTSPPQTPSQRPNILVIFGDDIGQSNISAYTHGLVGYQTPNIDRIAREGMMFIDYYAENSCTAGQLAIWENPFTCLRLPKMFNLRMDPYEHAEISGSLYDQWRAENGYLIFDATTKAAAFLETFVEYPPSQPPASFSIDQIVANIKAQIARLKQQGASATTGR
jgi:hypothetical protein